jgi:hypothetical protein
MFVYFRSGIAVVASLAALMAASSLAQMDGHLKSSLGEDAVPVLESCLTFAITFQT